MAEAAPAPAPAPQAEAPAKAAPMRTAGKRASVDAARTAAAKAHGSSKAPQAFDPRLTALKAMRERKGVRLAAEDGETVEGFERSDKEPEAKDAHTVEPVGPSAAAAAAKTKPTAPKSDKQPEAKAKAGDEKEPSWAAKLRTDHEAAVKKAADLEQHRGKREAEWENVHSQVQAKIQERDYAIEDLQSDLKLGQHLQAELMRILESVAPGDFIKESLELVVARHENDKLKRQQARGGQASTAAKHAQKVQALHGQIKTEVAGWIAKHPELDHKGSPEAKAFWSNWLKSGAPQQGFEGVVDNFVAAQRWRASQSGKRSVTTGTRPARESADVPDANMANVGAGSRPIRPGDVSRSGARRALAEFHAARGVR